MVLISKPKGGFGFKQERELALKQFKTFRQKEMRLKFLTSILNCLFYNQDYLSPKDIIIFRDYEDELDNLNRYEAEDERRM